jgi:hypothetical protein
MLNFLKYRLIKLNNLTHKIKFRRQKSRFLTEYNTKALERPRIQIPDCNKKGAIKH